MHWLACRWNSRLMMQLVKRRFGSYCISCSMWLLGSNCQTSLHVWLDAIVNRSWQRTNCTTSNRGYSKAVSSHFNTIGFVGRWYLRYSSFSGILNLVPRVRDNHIDGNTSDVGEGDPTAKTHMIDNQRPLPCPPPSQLSNQLCVSNILLICRCWIEATFRSIWHSLPSATEIEATQTEAHK